MVIAVDFDGTVVSHEFPLVGKDIGAVPVLKELIAAGHQLILWTMRSDKHDNTGASDCIPVIHNGNFLSDAIEDIAYAENAKSLKRSSSHGTLNYYDNL